MSDYWGGVLPFAIILMIGLTVSALFWLVCLLADRFGDRAYWAAGVFAAAFFVFGIPAIVMWAR